MTDTTRIPPTRITGLQGALIRRFSTKLLGEVPESLGVMWHHKPALMASLSLGRKSQSWDACDPQLKSLAHMATAATVGCSFCLDLGYFQARNEKLDLDKAREVPRWRESTLFTPLERDVLAYAEAMTATPPTVTDELSARLLEALGAPGLVEVTAIIAMENMMARSNVAMGIRSQGFAEACGLRPLAEPSGVVPSTA
ncbi:carboxymuconolactone decarboxylase family protein [Nocardioides sp. GXQ0305]|uniref:carboxymuconolactone decarboxylase family protein n=1 Tax=Nocardioides sp. GXQ0305 TaxID=3423912 RepID=UPI003D7E298A